MSLRLGALAHDRGLTIDESWQGLALLAGEEDVFLFSDHFDASMAFLGPSPPVRCPI